MAALSETSDAGILDLLRRTKALGVSELASATRVTPTAVRQRLTRLLGQGLIERVTERAGRGRPSHRYSLTPKGQRQTGNNHGDLAAVLWEEVRAVRDPDVRRGLFRRLAERMAGMYAGRVVGDSLADRMTSVVTLFAERNIPLTVEYVSQRSEASETDDAVADDAGAATYNSPQYMLPVLTALSCPYPELAEKDRGVCAMERMVFSQLLGTDVRLSDCRLDGGTCCRFETN